MNKKFTKLIAALALLTMVSQPFSAVCQTRSNITYTFSNKDWNSDNGQWADYTSGGGFESSGDARGISIYQSTINGTSPIVLSNVSSITVVASANSAGPTLTIYKVVDNTETSIYSASMTKDNNKSYTVNLTGTNTFSGKIKVVLASSTSYKSVWIKSVAVTYTADPTITIGSPTGGTISVTKTSDGSAISTGTIAAGTGITLGATPNTGYEFTTWNVTKTSDGTAVSLNSAATVANNSFSMPSYNTTVNATFTKQRYNVTITDNENDAVDVYAEYGVDGLLVEGETDDIEYEDIVALTADGLDTDEMISWQVIKTTGGDDVTASVLSSITADGAILTIPAYDITVNCSVVDLQYIVTYKANGGAENDVVEYYSPGENVTVADNAFTYSGHVFKKWNTSADGNGTNYDEGATISSIAADVTLYAQWAEAWTVSTISNSEQLATSLVEKTQSITLPTPNNIPSGFAFIGWTAMPSTPHALVSNPFTPTANTTLYAVFAKTIQEYEEKTVLFYGKALQTGDDITESITRISDGISYTLVPSSNNKIKRQKVNNSAVNAFPGVDSTILIGKEGAYIKNTTAFGEGITKFEVYQNYGASAKVTVGIYFSASAIDAYNASSDYTWTATLSPVDHVFDASSKLPSAPSRAKYFWYQVTNDNNSQIAFRITYIAPVYYTRIYPSGTFNADSDITIISPTIIPSGAILNMGTNSLTNTIASNLIIEDGGQLIVNNTVAATVQKTINAANGWGPQGETPYTPNNWYFIAAPITGSITANGLVTSGTDNDYDLFYFDEAETYWRNNKEHTGNTDPGFGITQKQGYLYASQAGTTIEFSGTVQPDVAADGALTLSKTDKGWNLVGNPYPFEAYASKAFYKMNDEGTALEAVSDYWQAANVIKPCTGILVYADSNNEGFTFSKVAPNAPAFDGHHGNVIINLAQQNLGQQDPVRGEATTTKLDNAIVSFNENEQLKKFYFGTQNANLYIPQGTEEYAIVSTEAQGEMPVNFRANENGTYTLSVNTENVEMNYLHLIDNMTGADVDLLHTPSYSFEAKTSDFESRFRLVFASNGASTGSASEETFAFISNGNIIVNGEGTLQVIDVTGRLLLTREVNSSLNTPHSSLTPGVYIIRLINGDNVRTQKIVIE